MISPSVERLCSLISYDSTSGHLRWLDTDVPAGYARPDGYVGIKIDGSCCLAHRVAWAITHGAWPDAEIDHWDRNRANNSLRNLRRASSRQNKANTGAHRNNKCGIKGVCFNPRRGKWRADIRLHGKKITLGHFATASLAALAYQAAAFSQHGEYAESK